MIDRLRSSEDSRVGPMLELAHRLFLPQTLEKDELLLDEIDGKRSCDVRYFVWDEQGVQGFCRAAWLSSGTLIVHLGVAPERQGSGIGSRLLRLVRETSGLLPIFAEVEGGDAEAWWSARGAHTIWPTYQQPPLHPDTGPVPLNLMAIGTVKSPVMAIQTIYREFYGIESENALLQRVLRGVCA